MPIPSAQTQNGNCGEKPVTRGTTAAEHLSIAPAAHLPESPAELLSLGMTPREAEILFWITQGKSNPEIAIILEMRLVTVKKHVQNVLQKLGVENRTAALREVTERLV